MDPCTSGGRDATRERFPGSVAPSFPCDEADRPHVHAMEIGPSAPVARPSDGILAVIFHLPPGNAGQG